MSNQNRNIRLPIQRSHTTPNGSGQEKAETLKRKVRFLTVPIMSK
jgi:hypothetical protein